MRVWMEVEREMQVKLVCNGNKEIIIWLWLPTVIVVDNDFWGFEESVLRKFRECVKEKEWLNLECIYSIRVN